MLEAATPSARYEAARELYQELALATAAYYEHLDVEERRAAPAMCAARGQETVFQTHKSIARQVGVEELRRC